MARALALLAAAWAIAAPARATASSKAGAKILVLRVESTAIDDATRQSLTSTLAETLKRYKHYQLLLSKTDLVEEMFAFECTEAGVECLTQIGGKYKADKVIYSEVAKDGQGKLEWSLRVVALKPVARVEQSTRQPLEGQDANKVAERALLVLVGPVDLPTSQSARQGTLVVKLAGGGVALVYVDDRLLGRTSVSGLSAPLPAGRYRLKVVRAGYREFETIITIAADQVTELAVPLELLPAPTTPPPGAPQPVPITKKWWFWTGITVGVAAVGVGIWAATRGSEPTAKGTAAFSFDDATAHLDPVFGGR